jgi:dihydroorotate dehydrogenase (NAD+) catalytic subunit
VKEIRHAKTLTVPVVVSVYGFTAAEYATVARQAADAGADAVELNVSCPHVKETGSEIGQDADVLAGVVKAVRKVVRKPVFVKLSPNVTDIIKIAETAVLAGADGLTAVNTVRAIAIDAETQMPILGNKRGGLSGCAIKPVAVRSVFDIYERVKTPIVGCGGIADWSDAVEFLLAGASAVQIGTAVSTKGPEVFRQVAKGIRVYMRKKRFRSVKEIVGLAHRR